MENRTRKKNNIKERLREEIRGKEREEKEDKRFNLPVPINP